MILAGALLAIAIGVISLSKKHTEAIMTKEEILNKLKELGIPVNNWENTRKKSVTSPIIEKQKENLLKLHELLELQIQKDVETVADLHIALQKVRGRKDGE